MYCLKNPVETFFEQIVSQVSTYNIQDTLFVCFLWSFKRTTKLPERKKFSEKKSVKGENRGVIREYSGEKVILQKIKIHFSEFRRFMNASATTMSEGRVILMFSKFPSTVCIGQPVRSSTDASSVNCRSYS